MPKFKILVSFSLLSRSGTMSLAMATAMEPLLVYKAVFLDLKKIDRTKIIRCTHYTNPEEYSAGKKDNNTKKICQQNIVNQNNFDTLHNHKVISRPLNKREICIASCNECRSINRNNISCGDNLRFI